MKMMWAATHLVLFSIFFVMVSTRPTELDNIFNEYLKNVKLHNSEKQTQIIKRRVDDNNQDVDIKKLSLQSLIGDLEHNFFKSASDVSSIIPQSSEPITTKPTDNENHPLHKRKTTNEDEVDHKLQEDKTVSIEKATTDGSIQTSFDQIITKEAGPTQIQVKHIIIQPHYGNLSILPTFELQHPKPILTTIKDSYFESTEATTTDRSTTQGSSDKSNEHIEKANEKDTISNINYQTEVSHNSNNHVTEKTVATTPTTTAPTTATPTTTTSTTKSVAQLKETEAELKEKVAEIEAEPIILSARV